MEDVINVISGLKSVISDNQRRIKELEDDIKELNSIKGNTEKLINIMNESTALANNRVNNIISELRFPIKVNFFDSYYAQICNSKNKTTRIMNDDIEKTARKISDCMNEIKRLTEQNANYSTKIQKLENEEE